MNYAGSYWLLSLMPSWVVIVILFSVVYFFQGLFRWNKNGFYWNASASSLVGDNFLIFFILIGHEVLKQGVDLSGPFFERKIQFCTFVSLVTLASFINRATFDGRWGEAEDHYHDFVVIPLLAYLVISLAPVIYLGGVGLEKFFAVAFFLGWAALGRYDILAGRINQKKWLKEHKKIV